MTVTRYHAPRTRVSNTPHLEVPVAPTVDIISIGLLRDVNNPDDSTIFKSASTKRFRTNSRSFSFNLNASAQALIFFRLLFFFSLHSQNVRYDQNSTEIL